MVPNDAVLQPHLQIDLVLSERRRRGKGEADWLRKDLSAVARVGNCIFLGCDEAAGVERLKHSAEGSCGDHRHFKLSEFFDLPGGADGEMDIEGLCAESGYLWVVGSHSLKRCKPKRDGRKALKRIAKIKREPNRFFLGRIPLVEEEPGVFALTRENHDRRAACFKVSKRRSALIGLIAKDPHLAGFLSIPSKENGLDIEGIVVRGSRMWLGLRGPVLRGHAVVLELEVAEKSPGKLVASRLEGGLRFRKHLLDTRGLGIRDMLIEDDDLLLLVGPTMSSEGPAFVLRWRDAVHTDMSGVIADDRIEKLAALPYRLHSDHPEGIDFWPEEGADALLVIYDAPAPERTDVEGTRVRADVIRFAEQRRKLAGGSGGT